MNILEILGFTKAEHEREVLSDFLKCLYANNNVSYEIESRESPEPDVLVKVSAKEEYYELARILDFRLIWLRLKALMIAPKLVQVDASKFGFPERDIVISKLKKNYTTESKDLNLLLYYDLGILNGGYPPLDLNTLYNDTIGPLKKDGCIFKTIYIFDRPSQKILWNN